GAEDPDHEAVVLAGGHLRDPVARIGAQLRAEPGVSVQNGLDRGPGPVVVGAVSQRYPHLGGVDVDELIRADRAPDMRAHGPRARHAPPRPRPRPAQPPPCCPGPRPGPPPPARSGPPSAPGPPGGVPGAGGAVPACRSAPPRPGGPPRNPPPRPTPAAGAASR